MLGVDQALLQRAMLLEPYQPLRATLLEPYPVLQPMACLFVLQICKAKLKIYLKTCVVFRLFERNFNKSMRILLVLVPRRLAAGGGRCSKHNR